MKIQRSDRQNKETSNIDKTNKLSSIDHEIEESISKLLKTETSNIEQTSDENIEDIKSIEDLYKK